MGSGHHHRRKVTLRMCSGQPTPEEPIFTSTTLLPFYDIMPYCIERAFEPQSFSFGPREVGVPGQIRAVKDNWRKGMSAEKQSPVVPLSTT
jgi:hypothetical protein